MEFSTKWDFVEAKYSTSGCDYYIGRISDGNASLINAILLMRICDNYNIITNDNKNIICEKWIITFNNNLPGAKSIEVHLEKSEEITETIKRLELEIIKYLKSFINIIKKVINCS